MEECFDFYHKINTQQLHKFEMDHIECISFVRFKDVNENKWGIKDLLIWVMLVSSSYYYFFLNEQTKQRKKAEREKKTE